MGLKGGRTIVVRDFRFLWKTCHPSVRLGGSAPRYMDIIVHAIEAKEYDYEQSYEKHSASLTPVDVRLLIEKAMDDGWDPGEQHELIGPLKLNNYSVRVG